MTIIERIARTFAPRSPRPWRDSSGGTFPGSARYWEQRYTRGGSSGAGSYGQLAEFKAEILNQFVDENGIASVIEFGCGDGNQLGMARYGSYIGLDVSRSAIAICAERFREDSSKSFFLYDSLAFVDRHVIFRADLALSLDVIYHLVEDKVYETYMSHLFGAAGRFVIVYSSDCDDEPMRAEHIKHRKFTEWVRRNAPGWVLDGVIDNRHPGNGEDGTTSFCKFFIYKNNI